MKRLRFSLVLIVAAVAAIGFGGASAFASSGTATPFKAAYPGAGNAFWTCSGVHIANRPNLPGSEDIETCVASGDLTGYAAGTYASGLSCPSPLPPGNYCGNFPPYGLQAWQSDYNGALATSWTITARGNDNGVFALKIVAYYPS